jgi:hypothetical protein
MKKYFEEEDKEKEKGKFINLTFGINYEDIKDNFEEVDMNGDEKIKETPKENNKESEKLDNENKKKKRKK